MKDINRHGPFEAAGHVYDLDRLMLSQFKQDEGVICFPSTSLARTFSGSGVFRCCGHLLLSNANYFFHAVVFLA